MLLIPGTSTRVHLRENLSAAKIVLPAGVLEKLDGVAKDAVKVELHVATAAGH
jgi:aryl-alcohol dehydrogenase-like predicted oxidoreductase